MAVALVAQTSRMSLVERALRAHHGRDGHVAQLVTGEALRVLIDDAVAITESTLGVATDPNVWMPHGSNAVRAIVERVHLEVRRQPLALYVFRHRQMHHAWNPARVLDYAGPISSLEDLGRYLHQWAVG